jgi:hypothetical protein
MSLLETAAMNWRRTELSTSKHIERYLTLRAMCVDPSPLPFVKDEDQQGSLQNGLRRIFGTCKSLADHKTNKNSFAMNSSCGRFFYRVDSVRLFIHKCSFIPSSVYW